MQLTSAAVLIGVFAFVSSGVAGERGPVRAPTPLEELRELSGEERASLPTILWEALHPAPNCVWDRLGVRYCGPGDCVFDESRFARCAGEKDGGISIDYTGDAVCGPGDCLAENTGEVYCSTKTGGYAWYDRFGTVDCTGGCVRADADACVEGRVNESWQERAKPIRVLHHASPWRGPSMALRPPDADENPKL